MALFLPSSSSVLPAKRDLDLNKLAYQCANYGNDPNSEEDKKYSCRDAMTLFPSGSRTLIPLDAQQSSDDTLYTPLYIFSDDGICAWTLYLDGDNDEEAKVTRDDLRSAAESFTDACQEQGGYGVMKSDNLFMAALPTWDAANSYETTGGRTIPVNYVVKSSWQSPKQNGLSYSDLHRFFELAENATDVGTVLGKRPKPMPMEPNIAVT